jgi:hypothetical protein
VRRRTALAVAFPLLLMRNAATPRAAAAAPGTWGHWFTNVEPLEFEL